MTESGERERAAEECAITAKGLLRLAEAARKCGVHRYADAYKLVAEQLITLNAQGKLAAFEAGRGQWISPKVDLPDEDVLVLVAVWCESDDHDGVTQRWQEVHEATLYKGAGQLIAATVGDGEYLDNEITGWRELPAPPDSGDTKVGQE